MGKYLRSPPWGQCELWRRYVHVLLQTFMSPGIHIFKFVRVPVVSNFKGYHFYNIVPWTHGWEDRESFDWRSEQDFQIEGGSTGEGDTSKTDWNFSPSIEASTGRTLKSVISLWSYSGSSFVMFHWPNESDGLRKSFDSLKIFPFLVYILLR